MQKISATQLAVALFDCQIYRPMAKHWSRTILQWCKTAFMIVLRRKLLLPEITVCLPTRLTFFPFFIGNSFPVLIVAFTLMISIFFMIGGMRGWFQSCAVSHASGGANHLSGSTSSTKAWWKTGLNIRAKRMTGLNSFLFSIFCIVFLFHM